MLVLHRVKLMLLAIVAPEIIVLWALRQRMVARKLSEDHRLHIIHGFFISMGGFVEQQGDTLHPIASHVIGHTVSATVIRRVDIGQIADRSKGDEMSKAFALIQTLWFIVQCIARTRQRLPLIELEVVTLAFAALNIVIRMIWWEKPLDVRYPIAIRAEGASSGSNATEDLKQDANLDNGVTKVPEPVTTDKLEPPVTRKPEPMMEQPGIEAEKPESAVKMSEPVVGPPDPAVKASEPVMKVAGQPKSKPGVKQEKRTSPAFIRWIMAVAHAVDRSIDITLMMFEGEEDDAYIRNSATRVPTLWAGRLDKWQRGTAATIGIVLAMAFGAIHFAAWSSSFPTPAERVLWKVAAILVVAVPFLFFIGAAIVLKKGKIDSPYHSIVFNIIIPLGVFTYIVARAILIVLPFIALRSLPPEALKDVKWVNYVPHIG